MYRNCYYNRKTSQITEFTWDSEGNRVALTSDFTPFIFEESNYESKFKSVYGTNLKLTTFNDYWAKHRYVQNASGRIFYDISPEQQYLIKKYKKNKEEDYTKNDIRIFYLDIECPAPDEFPHPSTAKYEIDVLTIYNSLEDEFHMWGKHPYDKSNLLGEIDKLGGKIEKISLDSVIYHHIEDEEERLKHFLNYWEEFTPDIYTHWNGDNFDTPYLVNRLKLILGGDEWKRLSPVGSVRKFDGKDKFENPVINYKIDGVSCMDYMEVFRVFTQNQERESWSLDSVAQDVLDCGKIEYESSNLYHLSQTDWNTYCAYNLVDVLLLRSIENERRYLKLSRQTSYYGFGNPSDATGKVRNIAGYATLMGLRNGKIVHTDYKKEKAYIEGGFVKEPVPSMRVDVGSFDAKSLYPTNIICFNMSPETKVGRVLIDGDKRRMLFRDGGSEVFDNVETFNKWIKHNKYCIAFNNVIFDQKEEGIITKIVREQFERKELYGRLKKEAISNGEYELAVKYDDLRAITKVFVNSIYGILATPSSPFYDPEIANAITITGQMTIKYSAKVIEDYCHKKFKTNGNVVVAGDTDSVMCEFKDVFKYLGKQMFDGDQKLSKTGDVILKFITNLLNDKINKMLQEERFCLNTDFIFEREKACQSAIFFKKKQYAYYVLNNEGYDLEEGKRMKYTGVKVIKSEFSPKVKKMMDEVYHGTLSKYSELGHNECRKYLNNIIKDCRDRFYGADFIDVSKRQKANKLKENEDMFIDEFKAGKGCSGHISATINYNRLVRKLGLQGKYPELTSGSKVMWVYLKPNIYQLEKIAGFNGILPKEFGLEIDYDVQFDKLFMPVVEQVFRVIGWDMPSPHFDEKFDINDLFD